MVVAKRYIKERRTEWRLFIVYTQVTSRCSVQRDDFLRQTTWKELATPLRCLP